MPFALRSRVAPFETVGVTRPPRQYVPAFKTAEDALRVARWLPIVSAPILLRIERTDSVRYDVTADVDGLLLLRGVSRKLIAASEMSPIVIRTGSRLCVPKRAWRAWRAWREVSPPTEAPFEVSSEASSESAFEAFEMDLMDALMMPFESNVGLLLPGDAIDEDDDEIRIECHEVQAWLED